MDKVEFEFPEPADSGPIDIAQARNTTYNVLEIGKESDADVEISDDDATSPPTPPVAPKETVAEDDIEVVDDVPPEDRNRKRSEPPSELTDEELSQHNAKVQQRLRHFSKSYHDERRDKEQAQREANELRGVVTQLLEDKKRLLGDNTQRMGMLVDQAKKAAETELTAATENFRRAYETGDPEAVVKAQQRLTTATVRFEQATRLRKPTLQPPETPVKVPPTQPQAAPIAPPDEKANKWLEANTWFGVDKEMTAFALGLHNKLVNDDRVDPKSDEYYSRINKRMREVFPSEFGTAAPTAPAAQKTPEPETEESVVAPVTRSVGSKKYRLTKTQVALARELNIPLETYAKNAAALERKGQ